MRKSSKITHCVQVPEHHALMVVDQELACEDGIWTVSYRCRIYMPDQDYPDYRVITSKEIGRGGNGLGPGPAALVEDMKAAVEIFKSMCASLHRTQRNEAT